jgi:hypothetical protein
VTVFPNRYVRGWLLSLSTVTLPGVSSVITSVPSVVVFCETCAHATGTTTAKAMPSNIFFIFMSPFVVTRRLASLLTFSSNTGCKMRVLREIRDRLSHFLALFEIAVLLVRLDHVASGHRLSHFTQ